jgi:hypothetical protein
MGASASRIWSEICAIESDEVRAHVVHTTLQSPELVAQARRAGVYGHVLSWLSARSRGEVLSFPYHRDGSVNYEGIYYGTANTGPQRDTIQHSEPRWAMYSTKAVPTATTNTAPKAATAMTTDIIVSPAAAALDYFQEALTLLGIDDELTLTPERLKAAYKRASLRVHPDKGGTKEAFDAVSKAYRYVARILARVSPQFSAESDPRLTTAVTPKAAEQYRADPRVSAITTATPPAQLSAKKLDMSMFNRLFEENRLPDPDRDSGYGDWLKSGEVGLDQTDPRARTDVSTKNFESVMRQYAAKNPGAVVKHSVPESLVQTAGVTELGGEARTFTAAMDAGTQFTDLKEAYSSGATFFQDVAHVHVDETRRVNPKAAERERAEAMARADPEEKARIQAAMEAEAQRELLRRLRLAKQDTAGEAWNDAIRRRLLVNTG